MATAWKSLTGLVKGAGRLFNFTPAKPKSDSQDIRQKPSPYQLLEEAAERTADGITVLASLIWRKLTRIPRRFARFCRFFLYLNWSTIREVAVRTARQRLPGLSAEMAYHSTLALFPTLLAIIGAVSLFDSLKSTAGAMAEIVVEVVPQEVSDPLNQLRLSRSPELFSFSFVTSIWLFSGAIGSAMFALNHIHQVPHHLLRPFWRNRLVSLGLAIGSLSLLIAASGIIFVSDLFVQTLASKSCILETVGNCPIDQVAMCLNQPPVQECLLQSKLLDSWKQFGWPIALTIIATNFALVYRYGPSQRRMGTPLLPGAMIAAVAWAGISYLFKLYVLHFGRYSWTYGAIGAFIILLLWLYISCLIMLIGAQLNVTVGKAMQKQDALKANLLADALEPESPLNPKHLE
ncbi:MAG: YihY/virulence factor BrkB family protein [Oscillatoriales cyanobacterium RM2_1_1]|nr:YihY/virulence factor BrkB family protein [Oscillatoriales cyanobacterium SM2_3_0]NJO47567.1 YihY/virulence factor BrkB family protein [Oscillatoriales cyanobacterium RM2_1_1]